MMAVRSCLIDQNSEEVHNLQSSDEKKKILELQSPSVERFGVSNMQDLKKIEIMEKNLAHGHCVIQKY